MLEKKTSVKAKNNETEATTDQKFTALETVKDFKCDWRESKLISDNPTCHNFAFRFEDI